MHLIALYAIFIGNIFYFYFHSHYTNCLFIKCLDVMLIGDYVRIRTLNDKIARF